MSKNNPYSLYIHIPWCIKKCPYCDFNSHEKREDYDEQAYIDALIKDLNFEAQHLQSRTLSSIFIGGGTPSLFSATSFQRLLSAVRSALVCADNMEITLEANPGTAESSKFKDFHDIGINRLSIGIQSFNDKHLKLLGRIHNAHQAQTAIEMAQHAGFNKINLDLMFGLPQQTTQQASEDIRLALSYQTGHISHYQLTLEKNTLFYKKPPALPDDDLIWEMQTACQKHLKQNLQHYEISAYAAEQHQAKHNLNYWQFGDYLGIGAGAHSKLTHNKHSITRSWKTKHPRQFVEHAGSEKSISGQSVLQDNELPFEFAMNALRLKNGFTLQQYQQRTGLHPSTIQPTLTTLLEKELIQLNQLTYACTDRGWNFLNETLEYFLPSTSI